MNTLKRRQLVREYVRHALLEQGDLAFAQSLGKTGLKGLIEPFTDVAKTALAGVFDVASAGYGFAKTLLNVALMTVIPFARVDSASIRKEHEARSAEFKSKYKDVYDRTDKALGGDDFQAVLFAANPVAWMGVNAAKLGKEVLGQNYKSLTGKSPKKENNNHSGVLLNEEAFNAEALNDLNNSADVKEMRAMGLTAFKKYLDAFSTKINNIASVDSIAELERLTGEKIEEKGTNLASIEDEEERQETETTLIDAAKKGYNDTIADFLESEVKAVANVLGSGDPIVGLYTQLIGKLR